MKKITQLIITVFFITLSISSSSASVPKGIDWYDGPVENAFALAKKEGRPLFLYWGAVWCPPCNQMKKTVFSKNEFKKAIKNFIPVYLDGDHDRAQKWGEKLNAKGYPTMLILGPLGNEIMRLPTGVHVSKYVELMNLTKSKLEPVQKIYKRALSNKASKDDWKLLSGFSWYQSELIKKADRLEKFKELYLKAPVNLVEEKASFLVLYLAKWIYEDEEKREKLTEEMKLGLKSIISKRDLFKTNLEMMTWYGVDLVSDVFKDKQSMMNIYLLRMEEAYNDKSLSIDERVSTLYSRMKIEELKFTEKKKEYSNKLKKKVLEVAKWANKMSKSEYDRQAAMSTAVYLLAKTKQYDDAYKLALEQVKKAPAPYYFMNYLARIDNKRGDKDKALTWAKKSWEAAKGPATKFQWGVSYLNSIMKMAPLKVERFSTEAVTVFKQGMSLDDAFDGRNVYRFKSFKKNFDKWKKTEKLSKKSIEKLKNGLTNSCNQYAKGEVKVKCLEWTKTLDRKSVV